MTPKIFNFKVNGDGRGSLISLEEQRNIPFCIKRVYYIYGNVANIRRGFHAHKRLEQILICINGNCKILLDDGKEKVEVLLSEKHVGLYVGNMIWREMFDFSKDCVLLVIASDLFSEEDYIRSYDEFLTYV